ncbi:MAG: U32 family peptidase [Lentisphaeria bacterium]|nr:U32 family peptidase [Lentisphaeria bacterium]
MPRLPPPKPPELLAPAGREEAFHAVLEAGADAVYVAGKGFNMRRHRADVNFSPAELSRLVGAAQARRRRVYVTVNSLVSSRELPALSEWLCFLRDIRVDALIVQDPAVVEICRREGIGVPLHASTMMNVGCAEHARLLRRHGFTRVITSRDITVEAVRRIREESGIEVEYFVHGDLCSVQSGQCLTSGILFGKSSNRGQCMKPCRWAYDLVSEGTGTVLADAAHLLAARDLCLLQQVPELVRAGIDAFKIEGRMRTAETLAPLVRLYRQAIDACVAEPLAPLRDPATAAAVHRRRVRELTTGFAFARPGEDFVDRAGDREPVYLSHHGRLKSHAEEPPPEHDGGATGRLPGVTVVVGNRVAAEAAFEAGAEHVILGWEGDLTPVSGWSLEELRALGRAGMACGTGVVLGLPRVVTEREVGEVRRLLREEVGVTVFSLSTPALVPLFEGTGYELWGDAGLNVMNRAAAHWLQGLGFRRLVPAPEASLACAADLAADPVGPDVELPVHGPIEGMVLEHCLVGWQTQHATGDGFCQMPCAADSFALRDRRGTLRALRLDRYCRTHVLLEHDLAMLPAMGAVRALAPAAIRIDSRCRPPGEIGPLVRLYRQALRHPPAADAAMEALRELAGGRSFSYGAYPRGIDADDSISRLDIKRDEKHGSPCPIPP